MKRYSIEIHRKGVPATLINLEIPSIDIGLTDLIPSFQRLFDRILEAEIDDHGMISCSEGCGACCRQLIPISIPETFFFHDLLKSLPIEKQASLGLRFCQILDLVDSAGLKNDLKDPRGKLGIDRLYFDLKVDCPFLEDRRCIIYQFRPLVCREYHVTNPAEACANPYHHLIQKVKIKRNLGAMLAAFSAHLYSVPPYPIPLILASNWAEEHSSLTAQKWPGTWLFDKFFLGLTRLNDQKLELVIRA